MCNIQSLLKTKQNKTKTTLKLFESTQEKSKIIDGRKAVGKEKKRLSEGVHGSGLNWL